MNAAVCPYCRGAIEHGSGEELLCPGCGTPHHADCYAENGGCTVFGCSSAPAEEPKLHLTGSELASVGATGTAAVATPSVGPSTETPSATPARVKSPPPPLPPGLQPAPAAIPPPPRFGSGSVLFGAQPVAAVATSAPAVDLDFDPDPAAKNRTTFIVLGVLLGALGAHNFYAGYRGKAVAQLCITVLTLGLASPMSWVWAVIDVCTVDRDSKGIKFRS